MTKKELLFILTLPLMLLYMKAYKKFIGENYKKQEEK